jgi:hypothetical protein
VADGKLNYRAICVNDASYRFRIKRLETDFMFADGSVHTFPNWDIKSCRERYYIEEFLNVPIEEYLRMTTESGEQVEFGIKTSEIRKFIERKLEFFEDLLLDAANAANDDGKFDA